MLTDTLDGDVVAIEGDDLGHERPNDQSAFRWLHADEESLIGPLEV
jgi:hypothetical protein